MGTSKAYPGRGGRSPLLPPWANGGKEGTVPPSLPGGNGSQTPDQSHPQEKHPKPTIDLSSTRRHITQYATGGAIGSLGKGMRSYIRGMGGARNAARSSRAGRTVTRKLGGFFTGVVTRGTERSLENVGLAHLIGNPIDLVLSAIADALTPQGTTLDDEIARQAIVSTLEDVYEKYGEDSNEITNLDSMRIDDVRYVIGLSVTNYIYHRFLLDVMERLERQEIDANQALEIEQEIKDFIKAKVSLDLSNIDVLNVNWDGNEGRDITEQIYEQAYAFLEAVS